MRHNIYTREIEKRSEAGQSPERRLLVALLRRAILDYLGADELASIEAQEWLFEEWNDPAEASHFSFCWVCEQLGLDRPQLLDQVVALTGDAEQLRAFRKLN